MNKFLRTLVIETLLIVGVSAAAFAADAPDPIIGTWTLNVAKSQFSPGPAPKSQTRTYTQIAQSTALTLSGVAADGSQVSGQFTFTFKYDGKDYPITGSPDYDALSSKRVNGSTFKGILKRGGKRVGTATRTFSADGKVMTLATKAKDVKGSPYDNVMVFDKQ